MMRLLVTALVIATVLASESPDSIVPETDISAGLATMRYLLRDSTSKASAQLHSTWNFQVKNADSRGEGLLETFGTQSHRDELMKMGFDLVEEEDGDGGFKRQSKSKGYHNPEQLHEAFKKLARDYPKQTKLINLTKKYKKPKTIQGNSLYAMKISENAGEEAHKPNLLVVSNHHARELVTPELALHAAKQLLLAPQKDILKKNQVYVMWTMNPDGLSIVWNKNTWQRCNGRNVDLNRNYPIGWKESCAGDSGAGTETYRGTHPFSEIETQTMRAFQQHMNFAKVMDFHSYSREVRTNYGPCSHLPPQIDQFFQTMRDKFAQKMYYKGSRSCCMGGDIHYAYNRHGSLAYLTEIGSEFQPTPSDKDKTVKEVWPGLKLFLEIPIPVSGRITDAKGIPVVAKLEIPEYTFTMNERFQSGPDGQYHLWLPEGTHQVKITPVNPPGAGKTVSITTTAAGAVKHINIDKL